VPLYLSRIQGEANSTSGFLPTSPSATALWSVMAPNTQSAQAL
jgi:hypothetical protein